MLLSDFLNVMEVIAPASLAMEFDNVGLLVGTRKKEIRSVLVALDCTTKVVAEAAKLNADLILTHHPLMMDGVKHMTPNNPDTAAVYALIEHGIAMFAAHTNLDAAQGGVNDCLANVLGLKNVIPLPPENLGRTGELDAPMKLCDFAAICRDRLNTVVRLCGDGERLVKKVGLVGGAGGNDIVYGLNEGADVFVTGEVKHHQALASLESGIAIIEAGHYETERIVLLPLIKRLQSMTHDVQFNLTQSETACLHRI